MSDIITIDVKAVYERVLAALESTYDFGYVAYDERLYDDQIANLLDPNTYDKQTDEIQEAFSNNAWDYYLPHTIQEIVNNPLEFEALRGTDYWFELCDAIRERDEGDPLPQLIDNTYDRLLLYRLGPNGDDQDLPYGQEYTTDRQIANAAKRLARWAGIDFETNRDVLRQMVLEQSYYGGQLHVIWYGSVKPLLTVVNEVVTERAGGAKAKRHVIQFTDPQLLLLDPFNGSGYGDRVTGTVRKYLDVTKVQLDAKVWQYGWNAIAGVHAPSYKCDWRVS